MTANRTITELYQALRPLLLRDVAIAASGSRASSGGMEAHALSSNWHTGQLAETQAPWAATKNEWATALATHAALPDVHHAPVTAGTLIGLSGQQVGIATGAAYQFIGTGSDTVPEWRNVAELAGNGLTAASGVLAVGVSGLGLSVGADAVALTSSSNPGAAASILATNASGGLTLASLGVTGAATVGGDFTVGANVLFVNQAGTRVGINRAPDQQFDLDVAGAIRGQYLVGRHAIQLASAVGVWHFDGSAPYNLDFTGSNASHMGVGGTEAGGVIYCPGKFGKAVQVAEATTNLIANPSFEINLSGWTTSGGTRQTGGGKYGDAYLSAGSYTYTTATITNGLAYTVSFWHRGRYSINVDFGNGTAYSRGSASAPVGSDGWGRYTETFTANGTAFRLFLYNEDYDAVQLEQVAYATPYCDGSLGTGHSWSGTAHASTSSRTSANIQYNVPIADAKPFTIMAWARNIANTTGTAHQWMITTQAFVFGTTTAGAISFYWTPDATYRTSTATLPADGSFHHVAMSYNGANTVRLFLDGVEISSSPFTVTNLSVATSYLRLRQPSSGDTYNGNWLIDDLVILDYAADAKLVRAIYESDAPVFVESSVFHWRAPSRVPIWVDEFGLWARGVSGNEILGLYGGDPRNPTGGVTKSWGGVTLSENDVLIGRAAGGYVFWDDSAQVLNLKGTMVVDGNSYLNGVVTIAAGGELRQGTGTLGSNYTGLRIWRESSIGRIGGYNANTLQWYAGTDGKLYAGGGNVVADSTGLSVIGAATLIIKQNASTIKGYLYSSNPLDSLLTNSTGVGMVTAGASSAEAISLLAKAAAGRRAELAVEAGGTAATNRIRAYAYSGSSASSILEMSETQLSVSIGGTAENLNVSPTRTFIANYVEMAEMTAPSAPASNGAYLYLDDNGSGKTRLMVRFSSGSAVQLAIQP